MYIWSGWWHSESSCRTGLAPTLWQMQKSKYSGTFDWKRKSNQQNHCWEERGSWYGKWTRWIPNYPVEGDWNASIQLDGGTGYQNLLETIQVLLGYDMIVTQQGRTVTTKKCLEIFIVYPFSGSTFCEDDEVPIKPAALKNHKLKTFQ